MNGQKLVFIHRDAVVVILSDGQHQEAITALSRADPGRPIEWRIAQRPHAAWNVLAVHPPPWPDPADLLFAARTATAVDNARVGEHGVVVPTEGEADDAP